MSWTRPSLDRIGQVAFIAMCLVVSAVGIQRLFASPPQGTPERRAPLEAGSSVSLHPALKSDRARGSLVLALSTECRFCTASMPFYAKLAGLEAVRDGRIHLAAMSLQPEEQMRAYLAAHRVPIDALVLFRDSGLAVKGTPTLVLLDRNAVVVNSWAGQLRPDEEDALIRDVGKLASR